MARSRKPDPVSRTPVTSGLWRIPLDAGHLFPASVSSASAGDPCSLRRMLRSSVWGVESLWLAVTTDSRIDSSPEEVVVHPLLDSGV